MARRNLERLEKKARFHIMSRRRQRKSSKSQKREQTIKRAKKRNLWWKVLLGVFVMVLGLGIYGYKQAIAFLHSEDFRKEVSLQVGDQLGGEGEFEKFKWDGMSGSNSGFTATSNGLVKSVIVKDIELDVDVDFIKRDKFTLENVRVGEVTAEVDLTKDFVPFIREKKEKSFLESLIPEEAELNDAKVTSINAKVHTNSGDYSIESLRAEVEADGSVFNITAKDGYVNLPLDFLKTAYLEEAKIKQSGENIYINKAILSIFGSGKLELTGDLDLSETAYRRYDLTGKLSGLKCKDVFPDDWQKKLKGDVEADLMVRPGAGDEPKITGHLKIKNGELTALPVLDKVAYYLANEKYRRIEFQTFECDFEKFKDVIDLKNISLVADGVVRIEGDLEIDGRKLDGLFNVGLPAKNLRSIPGAETLVFKRGKDNLNWTQVRISGTIDNIKEDLTDRLIAAAGMRMIQVAQEMTGEVISPETVKSAMKAVGGIAEASGKLLEGDAAGGIQDGIDAIGGIFGPNPKKDVEKDEDPKQEEKGEKENEGGIIPKLPKIPFSPF